MNKNLQLNDDKNRSTAKSVRPTVDKSIKLSSDKSVHGSYNKENINVGN